MTIQKQRFAIANTFVTIVLCLCNESLLSAQDNKKHGTLRITENGHFFEFQDGTPFFWLGDTAWEIFVRLKKEEIEKYLENRKKKGFNVIQAVAVADTDNPLQPNQYNELPLVDNNPEKPNDRYFDLIDWTIHQARKKNMFIALIPMWGDKVSKFWGTAEAIFNEQNAYAYGLYLGKRYKNSQNVIWVTGGDRPAFVDSMDWRPVWRALIKGLRQGTNNNALITYHPWGEHSSSEFWSNTDSIIDFNMQQSGHARYDIEVWKWIDRDFHLAPPKPVLDGEPTYEDHAVNWKFENGYFRDYDVRKQLYRSVFSGACGVTYGHQALWQFCSPREKGVGFPECYWTDAIDRPGAFQAGYLKRLILSRPSLNRIADQSFITDQNSKEGYITAYRDNDSTFAMIYMPIGEKIELNLTSLKAEKLVASWFNPRTSKTEKTEVFLKKNYYLFTPPTEGIANDWVLVLDDASKRYIPLN